MSKIHFEKLTPVNDIELVTYGQALDYVFENNDIKNVAISGGYSAGKSSLIESYKKTHKEYTFLHISLANFEFQIEEKNKELDEEKQESTIQLKEVVLEGKILNQLLHQIDPLDIPQTNFRIKQSVSKKSILKSTLLLVAFIGCWGLIVYKDEWAELINKMTDRGYFEVLKITTSPISTLIALIALLLILAYGIFKGIEVQQNKSILKKLSVQGNEVEIFESNNESYFDKYLNEVLYLFEKARADVIVFEDMDRYNIHQIFQRLREVNTLINIKRQKDQDPTLRFFYLLKDDIFTSKDRTKFFDFIIPVVPVIDSSNSYNQFIEHFKKGSVYEKFEQHFLQRVALYVDDMRLLKNIYNEFIIYYKQIGNTDQDYNKLLAMIIYKNIFPRDFGDTQLGKGFISTIFNNKDEIIKSNIDNLDKKIQKLEDEITLLEKEHVDNIEDLGEIYYRTDIYGHKYPDTSNSLYIQRKERLEMKQKGKVNEWRNEIDHFENEKIELKNKRVRQLITRNNEKEVFSICYTNFLGNENKFKEVKQSSYFDLIKYLIWEGYIDETYNDYMTYFYPNSLSTNDKKFIRSVTDKKSKGWEYKIDKPKLAISMLRDIDFQEPETLNFDIFKELCADVQINENKLEIFIVQLQKDKQYTFISSYLKHVTNPAPAVININKYWGSFITEVINNNKLKYEQIKEYIVNTIYYCNNDQICEINKEQILSNYIANDLNFLAISNPEKEKIINGLVLLDVQFKKINYNLADKNLFIKIYENNLYEFSYENIVLMLNTIYEINDNNKITHKNYSMISKQPQSLLYLNVKQNMDIYIRIYLDNCSNNIQDEKVEALQILNDDNISIDNRLEYIKYLKTNIEVLNNVKEIKLWEEILIEELVRYNFENILSYYDNTKNGIDKTLISFINSKKEKLKFNSDKIKASFDFSFLKKFASDIVVCKNIDNRKYASILTEINHVYDKFDITEIQKDKMSILIDNKIIKMNLENVLFVEEHYEELLLRFIFENIEYYFNTVIDHRPLKYKEIVQLISKSIADNIKLKLLSYTNEPISVINNNYSNTVIIHILEHNFDINEMNELVYLYPKVVEEIREKIVNVIISHLDIVIENKANLDISLLDKLMTNKNIKREDKLLLLANQLKDLGKDRTIYYLDINNFKEILKVFNNGRPKIEISEANRCLLEGFKKQRWIIEFSQSEKYFKIKKIPIKIMPR